jgi:integrase
MATALLKGIPIMKKKKKAVRTTRAKKSEEDLNFSVEEQDRLFSYWTAKKDEALQKGITRPVKTWFMFKFIIGTGLRASEVCNLKIKDLNLESKTPHVIVRNGKGNKRRAVYCQVSTLFPTPVSDLFPTFSGLVF